MVEPLISRVATTPDVVAVIAEQLFRHLDVLVLDLLRCVQDLIVQVGIIFDDASLNIQKSVPEVYCADNSRQK